MSLAQRRLRQCCLRNAACADASCANAACADAGIKNALSATFRGARYKNSVICASKRSLIRRKPGSRSWPICKPPGQNRASIHEASSKADALPHITLFLEMTPESSQITRFFYRAHADEAAVTPPTTGRLPMRRLRKCPQNPLTTLVGTSPPEARRDQTVTKRHRAETCPSTPRKRRAVYRVWANVAGGADRNVSAHPSKRCERCRRR